jgi:hypothetical protein
VLPGIVRITPDLVITAALLNRACCRGSQLA